MTTLRLSQQGHRSGLKGSVAHHFYGTARLVDRVAAVASAVTSAAEICPVALNDDGVRATLLARCRIYPASVSKKYPAMIWVANATGCVLFSAASSDTRCASLITSAFVLT